MTLDEFLHIALLYLVTNTGNINVVTVLEQYFILVKKECRGDFCIFEYCERVVASYLNSVSPKVMHLSKFCPTSPHAANEGSNQGISLKVCPQGRGI